MRNAALIALAIASACSPAPGAAGDDDGPGIDSGTSDGDSVEQIDPDWPPLTTLPAEFDFPPYLNLLDATTVVVSWRSVAASTGVVRFGPSEAMSETAASTTAANLHHVTLANLTSGAAYFYEVAIDGTAATRKGVFVLPGRAQWRFLHFGEFHAPSESSNVAKFTSAIREFRPHVLLESGDMVDDGNDLDHWRSYMQTSAPWISNVLLLPAHSNHVNGDGGNTHLKDLFALSNNERWYTTRYGQVEFFSLDSTFRENDDVEDVEVPWLASNAALAHDGAGDPTFVVAAWHHPACSSQYFTRQSERAWVQTNFVNTFKANGGVDLIFAAHDKYYERDVIDGGIQHVITNVGNVSPEIPGGNHEACTVMKSDRSTQSIGLVTVDGSLLATRIIDENAVEIDAFMIQK
jgi:hypothetical protein